MKSSRNKTGSSLPRRITRAFLLFLSYILIAAGLYILPQGDGIGIILVFLSLPFAALILATIWTMYYTLGAICASINSNFRSNKPNLVRLISSLIVMFLWGLSQWLIAAYFVNSGYSRDYGFLATGIGLTIAAVILSWILHPKPLKSALARFRSRTRKPKPRKKTSSSWNRF